MEAERECEAGRAPAARYAALIRLRRACQAISLALFLYLLVRTVFQGSFTKGADAQLAAPVNLFLRIDPLTAVVNVLSTGALYRGLLWSLAVLIPTLFFGRLFCGWICPFGTLHHFFGNLRSNWKRGQRRLASNRYQRWQSIKYWLLAMVLISALAGAAVPMVLDPLSFLVRSFAVSVFPTLDRLSSVLPYPVDVGLRAVLVGFRPPQFQQAFFIGFILLAMLVANLWFTRFWCRALCPLGALLGLTSRWSILGLQRDRKHCDNCSRCLLHCQGGDDPIPGAKWRKAECHLCLNCAADCPDGGLRFRLFPNSGHTQAGTDLRRRQALTAAAAGIALAPLMRAGQTPRPIRPPGSLEESAFLARCIRCGECMKVCPNNALQPAWTEAGAEGFWTPVLAARAGFCEPGCTLCGAVCPTGAIWPFTAREKGWDTGRADAAPIRIGTAFYDRGRCLPWAMATECIVCEEWCPTSPKAIYLRPAEAVAQDGTVKTVRQPYIDPKLCVGCGACEFACPVRTAPAIYVSSIGESRSRTNQILLKPPPRHAG